MSELSASLMTTDLVKSLHQLSAIFSKIATSSIILKVGEISFFVNVFDNFFY